MNQYSKMQNGIRNNYDYPRMKDTLSDVLIRKKKKVNLKVVQT